MGNMSYCRFENTANDLQDCYDALREKGSAKNAFEDAGQYEKEKIRYLLELCRDINEEFGDEIEELKDLEDEEKEKEE